MMMTKRQRNEKAHKNGTKENPRTKVRTSEKTNNPPGEPSSHRASSGERAKTYKKRSQD